MAGCIENLLAQSFRNFNGFKDFNRPPLEDRVQGLIHDSTTSMLLLQHTYVAIATRFGSSQLTQRGRNLVPKECHSPKVAVRFSGPSCPTRRRHERERGAP